MATTPPALNDLDHCRVPDVDALEGDLVSELGPGHRQVGEVPRRQIVDHVDAVPLGQQPVDEVGADEAGPARDQGPHGQALTRPPRTQVPASTVAAAPTTVRSATSAPSPTRARSPRTEPS